MKPIHIKATHATPGIVFLPSGHLSIEGRSLINDVRTFYNPLVDYLKELDVQKVFLKLDLEYVNSGSSRKISDILTTLNQNYRIQEINVCWYYEPGDEDSLEMAEMYHDAIPRAIFSVCELDNA